MRKSNLFKMPNNIFDEGLSAGELKALAALYSLRSRSTIMGFFAEIFTHFCN